MSDDEFSKRDLERVLDRVGELERDQPERQPTFTKAEIVASAREAGFDLELVERAMDELTQQRTPMEKFRATFAGQQVVEKGGYSGVSVLVRGRSLAEIERAGLDIFGAPEGVDRTEEIVSYRWSEEMGLVNRTIEFQIVSSNNQQLVNLNQTVKTNWSKLMFIGVYQGMVFVLIEIVKRYLGFSGTPLWFYFTLMFFVYWFLLFVDRSTRKSEFKRKVNTIGGRLAGLDRARRHTSETKQLE